MTLVNPTVLPATRWAQRARTRPETSSTQPSPQPLGRTTQQAQLTLCGLTSVQLHDRFWAARGVQVLRPGVQSELVSQAELFLLLGSTDLVAFALRPMLDQLLWLRPELMWVRLAQPKDQAYRERVVTDQEGRFIRFQRHYRREQLHCQRVALTRNLDLAQSWREADSALAGWRCLRRLVPRGYRTSKLIAARLYDHTRPSDVQDFMQLLLRQWGKPHATIEGLRLLAPGVWCHETSHVPASAHCVGSVWIGAGRTIAADAVVAGPAVLWDDPRFRPPSENVDWSKLVPGGAGMRNHQLRRKAHGRWHAPLKRLLDGCAALLALLLLIPIFPLIALAIYLEDGRPIFFAHERQGRGGRNFPCLKFRSMRKDADRIKAQLLASNAADGPQFFMENDPRVTRIGYRLRKYNLDELPQFINVLLGHMSLVGPRPSPHQENQYCPAWREARLSVRPGITGLWQVKRSRLAGQDFQEWIKYDIQYVETESLRLDLQLIVQTLLRMVKIR